MTTPPGTRWYSVSNPTRGDRDPACLLSRDDHEWAFRLADKRQDSSRGRGLDSENRGQGRTPATRLAQERQACTAWVAMVRYLGLADEDIVEPVDRPFSESAIGDRYLPRSISSDPSRASLIIRHQDFAFPHWRYTLCEVSDDYLIVVLRGYQTVEWAEEKTRTGEIRQFDDYWLARQDQLIPVPLKV